MAVDDGATNTIVERLRYWCQLVLPAVYDDSLSYYELVAKVVQKLNEVIDSNNQLAGYVADNTEDIAKLQEEFEKFKNGEFDQFYQDVICEWVNQHMEELVKQALVTGVWFGLTDDGHFCAYKPSTWKDIDFDTGAVFGRTDYGCLILRTSVDGMGVIDNSYSYTLNATPKQLEKIIADLEITTKRTDSVFDTVYTNMDKTLEMDGENV